MIVLGAPLCSITSVAMSCELGLQYQAWVTSIE